MAKKTAAKGGAKKKGAKKREDVPGVLDHGVLEAATGAEERDAALSREPDPAKRPLEAPVGAPGGAPDAGAGGEVGGDLFAQQLVRGKPAGFDRLPRSARMPECLFGRPVVRKARIPIADDADAQRHGATCSSEISTASGSSSRYSTLEATFREV
jgi:hypothetical protein